MTTVEEGDSMTEKDSVALVPRAVREVTFYDDTLLVALIDDVP
jgi:hypothetical protein